MASTADEMTYIYLDHAATSPLRPEARAAMEPFGDVLYANPSGSHKFAREARRAVDEARDLVASVIGCKPGEVVFTSGGTESNNLAVLGAARLGKSQGRCHLVASPVEHHAVLHALKYLALKPLL